MEGGEGGTPADALAGGGHLNRGADKENAPASGGGGNEGPHPAGAGTLASKAAADLLPAVPEVGRASADDDKENFPAVGAGDDA